MSKLSQDLLEAIDKELSEWLAGTRSWCDEHHGKPDEIELTARADEATIRLLATKREILLAHISNHEQGEREYMVSDGDGNVWALTSSLDDARHYASQEPGAVIETRMSTKWQEMKESK